MEYAGSQANLDAITLYFTRLVLGVQLVLAGVQLPSRYLQTEWKPLSILLGVVMTVMWICSSLIVWALVPNLPFLHALAIGACVTPTDPVLSNSIVKGKFADKNVPKNLQKIIVAESGANDGLGYPFLFLPLYIIKYIDPRQVGDVGTAMKDWIIETWIYTILLSVVYGFAVGWIAKELLHWAEQRKFIDRESFLVFAITLALFIVGTCGMIGSDDVLACFIAGNAFTWDDWFRLETLDDSLQPTIDMLLNLSIFIWFGAIAPWSSFLHNDGIIPIYRLIPLGILILLVRRLPIVYALHKYIHQIEEKRQALFVGFFGPIGVSAVFYIYISLDFLHTITVDGEQRDDAAQLGDTLAIVVWFLAICSIVVHGLSIPLGKLGFYLPRTFSQAFDSTGNDDPMPFRVRDRSIDRSTGVLRERIRQPGSRSRSGQSTPKLTHMPSLTTGHSERPIYRIGGTVIKDPPQSRDGDGSLEVGVSGGDGENTTPPLATVNRTIRFPDETHQNSGERPDPTPSQTL